MLATGFKSVEVSSNLLSLLVPIQGLFKDYDLMEKKTIKILKSHFEKRQLVTNLWPFWLQLNQEALKEHAQKLRSLPVEVRETVNVCVGAHFPEMVDQSGNKKVEGVGFYGDVFLGWTFFWHLNLPLS